MYLNFSFLTKVIFQKLRTQHMIEKTNKQNFVREESSENTHLLQGLTFLSPYFLKFIM